MQPTRSSLRLPNTPGTQADGTHELVFYDWGSPDSARVAVCVHGLTRNARDFDFLARSLAENGLRVLALNMPGRGESAWLDNPMHYHYGTYVADCLAVLDNFHLRQVDFIGTSMGGIIGMMLAAQFPKRIRKLVLNDIGSFLPKEALQRIYDYVATMPKKFATSEEAETYVRTIFAPFGITEETHWQHFISHSLEAHAGSWRLRCDPSIATPILAARDASDTVTDVNFADVWASIFHPTLILRGEHSDVLMPFTVEAMKSTNPHAQSRTIAGAGHAPSLMPTTQSAMITQWLSEAASLPLAAGL
jgi:pimeloyl-ACP methyl ester carboxylesterase